MCSNISCWHATTQQRPPKKKFLHSDRPERSRETSRKWQRERKREREKRWTYGQKSKKAIFTAHSHWSVYMNPMRPYERKLLTLEWFIRREWDFDFTSLEVLDTVYLSLVWRKACTTCKTTNGAKSAVILMTIRPHWFASSQEKKMFLVFKLPSSKRFKIEFVSHKIDRKII